MGRHSRALNFVIPKLPTPPSFGSAPLPKVKNRPKFSRQDIVAVKTFVEFLQAIDGEATQSSLDDAITATERIKIHQDITNNINNHSIVSNIPEERARLFEIEHGELTLTGRGKIFALGEENVVIRATGALSSGVPDYTVITIEKNIEIYAPEGHAILVTSNTGVAYGVKIDFAGKIFARNGIWLSARVQGRGRTLPKIILRKNAEITADDREGVALQAEGQGEWQLSAAKLSGAYGLCLYDGSAELRAPKISATGSALWLGGEELNLKVLGGIYAGEDYGIAGVIQNPDRVRLYGGEFWGIKNAVSPDLQILDLGEGAEFHRGEKDFQEQKTSNWGEMPKELIRPVSDAENEKRELVAAITDLKQLKSSDFTTGYLELMNCIDRVEAMLADETTGAEELHAMAEELLARMDALEMTDNSLMSDLELDNLFYGRRIPPELMEPDEPSPKKRKKWRIGMRISAKRRSYIKE